MRRFGLMLKSEPAMIGTAVAAIFPVLLILGLDPTLGGALATAVTVLAGLWIRSQVYSPAGMERKVAEAATAAVEAATPEAVGAQGVVTAEGRAIVDQVVEQVTPADGEPLD
jgi:hypothetical protein